MKRAVRLLWVTAALLAGALLMAATAAWLTLRASLPTIDGQAALPGLAARVSIERDAAGVPTITAQSRADLARASATFTVRTAFFRWTYCAAPRPASYPRSSVRRCCLTDRQLRLHRFREVARAALATLDAPSRALLDAYVAGVNAGIASLRSRPFEYWVLQSKPQPWSAEDSVLCVHAMFLQLQDSAGHAQLQRGLLRATLPEALWRFLEAGAPEWDAAIDGSRSAEPRVPGADEFDLRRPEGSAGAAAAGSAETARCARQQQLGGCRIAHRPRRGIAGQRHASGLQGTQYLVSRAPRAEAGPRSPRPHGRHPARHAFPRRRQQSHDRLGLYEQLWRIRDGHTARGSGERCRSV